jgi:ComF family protein
MLRLLLRAVAEALAWAIAPNRCAACDGDVGPMTAFCPACALTLSVPHERDKRHVAAFLYGGAVARAIVRLKFEGRSDVARPLAAALQRAARVMAAEVPDVVVPVPLHPRRLVERGFNPSALLARPVAHDLGATFLPRGLCRSVDCRPQVTLDRRARLTNVARAFSVPRPALIRERRVLIVDDVRTTGATLLACEKVLLDAGARDVRTLVVAESVAPGSA